MQRVYTCLVACAACLAAVPAMAQWSNETPSAQTEQQVAARLASDQLSAGRAAAATDNLNRSVITQQGNQNTGISNQQYTGAFLSGNVVNLTQVGDLNTAVLNQTGSGLRTDLTQQGIGNQVQSDMVGSNTSTIIEQEGARNQLTQQLLVNDRSYQITQLGSDNVLEQRESGAAAPRPGYNVQMVGNGIRLTIDQGVGLPTP